MTNSKEIQRKEIGTRIKTIRKKLGLNMKEFGEKFNPIASDSIVSRWERGVNLPNNERLKKIAELGNVSMPFLLEGKKTIEDIKKIAMEELNNNPEKLGTIVQFFSEANDRITKNLIESAQDAFIGIDSTKNSEGENYYIANARTFFDFYPQETLWLVGSTLARFNELHEEIQDASKSITERKKYIDNEIKEMIKLSNVVYDSVREALFEEIDKNK